MRRPRQRQRGPADHDKPSVCALRAGAYSLCPDKLLHVAIALARFGIQVTSSSRFTHERQHVPVLRNGPPSRAPRPAMTPCFTSDVVTTTSISTLRHRGSMPADSAIVVRSGNLTPLNGPLPTFPLPLRLNRQVAKTSQSSKTPQLRALTLPIKRHIGIQRGIRRQTHVAQHT